MMKKLLLAAVTFSLVAMIAAPAAAQSTATDPGSASAGPAAAGAGVLKKAQFQSANNQVNVGTTFTTVLSDSVVLLATGCILTQFHTEVGMFGAAEQTMSGQIRTLIGGVLGEGHSTFGQVFVSPDSNTDGRIETEGYNSWRCNLPPGTYSIAVQVANFASGTMAVRARTLVTSWKK